MANLKFATILICLKKYFVYFLVSNFDRRERKLLENGREREKVTQATFQWRNWLFMVSTGFIQRAEFNGDDFFSKYP